MGFSYPDWSGPFYPPGLKAGEYLSYYAKFFSALELDTTFYAAPPPERVKKWRDETPAGFRFCLKTPRAITHDTPLVAGARPMAEFVDACRVFEEKLGVVLIQFAPTFTADNLQTVDSFLATLPNDVKFAVEFRHRSWGKTETLQMLRERKCAFVSAEYASRPSRVFATTEFLYLRLIGVHNQFATHTREQVDAAERLTWWKDAVEKSLPPPREIWAFVNNDYAGYSPATAHHLRQMLGLPSTDPSVGKTGDLFE